MKTIKLIILFLILTLKLYGSDTYLLGVKNDALGGTGTAIASDIPSMYYNPANILLSFYPTLYFQYNYLTSNTYDGFVLGYLHLFSEKIVMALNIDIRNYSSINEYDDRGYFIKSFSRQDMIVNFASSFKLQKQINTGIKLKVVNTSFYGYSHSSENYYLDAGILYLPYWSRNLNFGISAQNIIIKRESQTNSQFNLRSGVSYKYNIAENNFLICSDFNFNKEILPLYSIGLEYSRSFFHFRLGFNEKKDLSAGIGIYFKPYKFDSAFVHNELFNKYSISMTFYIKAFLPLRVIQNYYYKGLSHFKDNQYDDALEYFEKVCDIDDNYKKGAYYYSFLKEKKRKEEEKLKFLKKQADIYYTRGEMFYKERNYSQSIEQLNKCLNFDNKHKEANELLIKAGEELTKNSSESKQDKEIYNDEVKRLFVLSENYYKTGFYKKGLKSINDLLKLSPAHSDALILKKQIEDKITEEQNKEKKGKNELSDEHLKMGFKAYQNKNFETALFHFNKVKELTPEKMETNDKLKKVLKEIHTRNDIDYDKDSPQYKLEKFHTDKDVQKIGKLNEKERDKRALKSRVVKLYNEGISYFKQKRYNKTIEKMKQVRKLDRGNKEALNFIEKSENMIRIEKDKKDISKQVSKKNKQLSIKHYLKGVNYYTRGDLNKAIGEWRMSLIFNPHNKKTRQSLKQALKKR